MSNDIYLILPEILISVFAMLALLVGAYFGQDRLARMLLWLTAAVLAVVAVIVSTGAESTITAFNGMFVSDGFARFAKVIILLSAAAVLVMSESYMTKRGLLRFEYPLLVALSAVGMMVMVSA
ncbi:MAG: NADH-quinone oxidoreductase subunit N, partial [Sulfitobacter sp.]